MKTWGSYDTFNENNESKYVLFSHLKNYELSVANCLSHSSSSSHIYPSNDKMILLLPSLTEDTDF